MPCSCTSICSTTPTIVSGCATPTAKPSNADEASSTTRLGAATIIASPTADTVSIARKVRIRPPSRAITAAMNGRIATDASERALITIPITLAGTARPSRNAGRNEPCVTRTIITVPLTHRLTCTVGSRVSDRSLRGPTRTGRRDLPAGPPAGAESIANAPVPAAATTAATTYAVRNPARSTSTPAVTGPRSCPTDTNAPYSPKLLSRSAPSPRRATIDCAATTAISCPSPASTCATSRLGNDGAIAIHTGAIASNAVPRSSIGFGPTASTTVPTGTARKSGNRNAAEMTTPIAAGDAPNATPNSGARVPVMKNAVNSSAAPSPRPSSGPRGRAGLRPAPWCRAPGRRSRPRRESRTPPCRRRAAPPRPAFPSRSRPPARAA